MSANAAPAAPPAPPTTIGEVVPLPPLALLDGRLVPPAAWRGEALVIVFFETDCGYCREHDARLERLSRAMRGRGLRVLGAAGDRSAARVRAYALDEGLGFDMTLDTDGALKRLFTTRRVVPFTAVLDRAGRLREAIPGALSEEDAMGLAKWAAAT
jgi:peroxiredoxin